MQHGYASGGAVRNGGRCAHMLIYLINYLTPFTPMHINRPHLDGREAHEQRGVRRGWLPVFDGLGIPGADPRAGQGTDGVIVIGLLTGLDPCTGGQGMDSIMM